MKPIKLTMEGFGPYGNKEIIDFTQLENKTLFLITGATGSGKTTIFDAISYVLYGEGSGENRQPKDFISQFSDLDTTTQVELIFELKGQEYKIKRVPEQLRHKKVGEGTTTQSTVAELEVIGKNLNFSGINDVNEKVKEIIGLDSDQFTQIMMIPQGEFRKMLVAESKEREKILQKLFDTTLYENIQQRFRDIEKEMRKDIENRESLLRQAAGRTEYKDDEKMKEFLVSEYYNYNGMFNLTESLIKKDEESINELKVENIDLKNKLKKENDKLIQAKKTNEKIEEKERLEKQLKVENGKKDYINSQEKKLEKGRKYLEIKPFEENYNDKRRDLKEQEELLKETKETKEKVDEEYKKIKRENDKVSSKEFLEEIVNLKEGISSNKKLLPKMEEKKEILEKLKNSESEKEKIDEEIKTLKNNLSNYTDENKKLVKNIENLIDLKDKLKIKENRASEIKNNIKVRKKIGTAENDIKKIEEKIEIIKKNKKQLQKKYEEKSENYNDIRERYYANMGAILAKDLKDGEACPVCGSKDHLKKTEFHGEDISKEDLNRLEKEVGKTTSQINKLENEETALNQRTKGQKENIESYQKDLENNEDSIEFLEKEQKDINNDITKLDQEIGKAENERKRHEELEKIITKLDKEKDGKSEKLNSIELEIAKYQTQLNEINKSLKGDKKYEEILKLIEDLEIKLKNKQNLKEKTNKKYTEINEEKIRLEAKINSIEENLKKTEKELEKKKKILFEKINEKGFKDKEEYFNSALEKENLKQIEIEIKNYNENLKILKLDIEKLEKETKNLKIIDTEKLTQDINLIEDKKSLCGKNITNLETKIKKSKELLDEIKTSYKKIEKLKEKHSKYSFLSGLVNGRGENGMDKLSLERFVQIEFFEDIINAANQRLKKMTEERYYMKRAEEYTRRRQIGLDLDVFDNYTGKTRSVKTLSGGESFKASLALALGLSDVVQSYSGGVQLDTIFIDEGFGSLDPESLESSINCLIDIQEKGRLVGIISHVEELKERIDTRLEVISTNRGSTTQFVVK
ncbi:MAG: SMC family ATPase [Eubacteriales bacterium]